MRRQPAIAIWLVPVGQHWLDATNVGYTGVCNTDRMVIAQP